MPLEPIKFQQFLSSSDKWTNYKSQSNSRGHVQEYVLEFLETWGNTLPLVEFCTTIVTCQPLLWHV